MNSIDIAAIGLTQVNDRLNVTAHNVANLSTPGYKRRVAVQLPFDLAMQQAQSPQTLQAVHMDGSVGKVASTGNPLDIALPAKVFIEVLRSDGNLALTKQGSLRLDSSGQLVTSAGDHVLGETSALRLPKPAQDVSIDSRGQLFADGEAIGALKLVEVTDTAALKSLGQGLYESDPALVRRAEAANLQPRHLEASNVVSSQEMVQLMTTARHAEALVKMIQGADELLEKAIRKFGDSQ